MNSRSRLPGRKLRRRALLRGAGGIVVALPFLEFFGGSSARAQQAGPKRFVVFFHHQGTILNHWAQPGTSETNFNLGEILSPLDGATTQGGQWRDHCLFLYGVDNKVAPLNLSNGHNSSSRTVLTADLYSTAVDGNGNYIAESNQPDVQGHSNGPSIDQELASRLQSNHPYRSIDVSVGANNSRLLYAGKDDPVDSEPDPQAVFDRFFSTGLESEQELERLKLRKLSVLDTVRSNFNSLRRRVGQADRERLDAHADKIRELEVAIENAKQCSVPSLDPMSGFDYQNDEQEAARLQMDLLTMAMACDLAPVGSMVFAHGHAPSFDWITDFQGPIVPSNYTGWHDMVHLGKNIQGSNGTYDEPGLVRGYKWYSEQFVELLRRFSETPEGDGTMLDNSLILWMSEFGNGAGHNTRKLHIVMAGNTGGSEPMGRCLTLGTGGDYDESPHSHNQVFVSCLNAFGYDDTTFGWQAPGVSSGGIPGIG